MHKLILLLCLLFLPGLALAAPPLKKLNLVFIGTYSGAKSQGIYVSRFDSDKGDLSSPELAAEMKNPSFLSLSPNGKFLYAVGEMENFGGKPSGSVAAFRIRDASGKLELLNEQSSEGTGPCHLALDGSGKFLLVANYDAGSFEVLPIRQGALGAPIDLIQHRGSSVNPRSQAGPHAHCVVTDKNNRRLLVTDLGLDKIMIYGFDSGTGQLTQNQKPWFQTKPGAGPRHFAFHRNGLWAYVINELDSTMTALAYDPASGELKEKQTISTLPANFTGKSYCAELQVAPSGKFLYGSNRGHDSIVVYSIDQTTGELGLVEHTSTRGKWPRNFAIEPGGRWLLAANQNSDGVVSFAIDPKSGKLSPSGHSVEIPVPVCVTFLSDKL